MNGLTELKEKVEREHNEQLKLIELMCLFPECGINIHTVGVGSAHVDEITYSELVNALRIIRRAGFAVDIEVYFYSNGFTVSYDVSKDDKKAHFIFSISDGDVAVKALGKGKCKIVESTVTKTEFNVECEL